jgi:8-oxo-dGTP pyrophosphatase MutT (NUDIX family)
MVLNSITARSRASLPAMLDLDPARSPAPPKDAATLLVLRAAGDDIEIFCVRRHAESAFMGGVVVFPGGKLDAADAADGYGTHSDGIDQRASVFADDAQHAHALAICACRESLEEAGLLPVTTDLGAEAVERMRAALADGESLLSLLAAADVVLATSQLIPFARWITPGAEQRRYDARFFMTALPAGQLGQHDDHETVSSVWATPTKLLEAFNGGDLMLAPPTVRALELLVTVSDIDTALALCGEQTLLPICPEFVASDPPALALPGDPDHSIGERRVAGSTRFVLDNGKFVSAQ